MFTFNVVSIHDKILICLYKHFIDIFQYQSPCMNLMAKNLRGLEIQLFSSNFKHFENCF